MSKDQNILQKKKNQLQQHQQHQQHGKLKLRRRRPFVLIGTFLCLSSLLIYYDGVNATILDEDVIKKIDITSDITSSSKNENKLSISQYLLNHIHPGHLENHHSNNNNNRNKLRQRKQQQSQNLQKEGSKIDSTSHAEHNNLPINDFFSQNIENIDKKSYRRYNINHDSNNHEEIIDDNAHNLDHQISKQNFVLMAQSSNRSEDEDEHYNDLQNIKLFPINNNDDYNQNESTYNMNSLLLIEQQQISNEKRNLQQQQQQQQNQQIKNDIENPIIKSNSNIINQNNVDSATKETKNTTFTSSIISFLNNINFSFNKKNIEEKISNDNSNKTYFVDTNITFNLVNNNKTIIDDNNNIVRNHHQEDKEQKISNNTNNNKSSDQAIHMLFGTKTLINNDPLMKNKVEQNDIYNHGLNHTFFDPTITKYSSSLVRKNEDNIESIKREEMLDVFTYTSKYKNNNNETIKYNNNNDNDNNRTISSILHTKENIMDKLIQSQNINNNNVLYGKNFINELSNNTIKSVYAISKIESDVTFTAETNNLHNRSFVDNPKLGTIPTDKEYSFRMASVVDDAKNKNNNDNTNKSVFSSPLETTRDLNTGTVSSNMIQEYIQAKKDEAEKRIQEKKIEIRTIDKTPFDMIDSDANMIEPLPIIEDHGHEVESETNVMNNVFQRNIINDSEKNAMVSDKSSTGQMVMNELIKAKQNNIVDTNEGIYISQSSTEEDRVNAVNALIEKRKDEFEERVDTLDALLEQRKKEFEQRKADILKNKYSTGNIFQSEQQQFDTKLPPTSSPSKIPIHTNSPIMLNDSDPTTMLSVFAVLQEVQVEKEEIELPTLAPANEIIPVNLPIPASNLGNFPSISIFSSIFVNHKKDPPSNAPYQEIKDYYVEIYNYPKSKKSKNKLSYSISNNLFTGGKGISKGKGKSKKSSKKEKSSKKKKDKSSKYSGQENGKDFFVIIVPPPIHSPSRFPTTTFPTSQPISRTPVFNPTTSPQDQPTQSPAFMPSLLPFPSVTTMSPQSPTTLSPFPMLPSISKSPTKLPTLKGPTNLPTITVSPALLSKLPTLSPGTTGKPTSSKEPNTTSPAATFNPSKITPDTTKVPSLTLSPTSPANAPSIVPNASDIPTTDANRAPTKTSTIPPQLTSGPSIIPDGTKVPTIIAPSAPIPSIPSSSTRPSVPSSGTTVGPSVTGSSIEPTTTSTVQTRQPLNPGETAAPSTSSVVSPTKTLPPGSTQNPTIKSQPSDASTSSVTSPPGTTLAPSVTRGPTSISTPSVSDQLTTLPSLPPGVTASPILSTVPSPTVIGATIRPTDIVNGTETPDLTLPPGTTSSPTTTPRPSDASTSSVTLPPGTTLAPGVTSGPTSISTPSVSDQLTTLPSLPPGVTASPILSTVPSPTVIGATTRPTDVVNGTETPDLTLPPGTTSSPTTTPQPSDASTGSVTSPPGTSSVPGLTLSPSGSTLLPSNFGNGTRTPDLTLPPGTTFNPTITRQPSDASTSSATSPPGVTLSPSGSTLLPSNVGNGTDTPGLTLPPGTTFNPTLTPQPSDASTSSVTSPPGSTSVPGATISPNNTVFPSVINQTTSVPTVSSTP